MAADGVTYGEVRWAPRLHLEDGLGVTDVLEAVAAGVADARASLGASAPLIGLIVTAMRSHPPSANVDLAQRAAAFGSPIVGFDLAGLEAEYPAPPHAAAFRAAAAAGLGLTAHAGETPGTERIWEVLEFGVTRIAHGAPAIEDEPLMDALRKGSITLDLCPTSNVQAGIVPDLASHPVARLHRAGVSVSLSTDDRTVSQTTLSHELAEVALATGMTADELAEIAINGFRRGFSPPTELAARRAEAARAWHAWTRNQEPAPGLIAPGVDPFRRPPGLRSASTPAAGSAATKSGCCSPVRFAAWLASVTPVRTSMLRMPDRCAPAMSDSGLSPMTIAAPRCDARPGQDGSEHRRLRLADDQRRRARPRPRWPPPWCPAPGRKPSGVGYRASALVAMNRAPGGSRPPRPRTGLVEVRVEADDDRVHPRVGGHHRAIQRTA